MSARNHQHHLQDAAKRVLKILNSHEGSRTIYDKWRDFIELSYCALAKTMAPDEGTANDLEGRYMRIVDSYRDKDAIRAYPEILALTATYCGTPHYDDFMGLVSGDIGTLSKDMGQFFTPMGVSRMMAQMQIGDITPLIAEQGYVTVGEPAAGAGGMILSAARVIAQQGHDPATTLWACTQDISYTAYMMCYVQLSLAGIPALVERRNTLRWELYERAWTPAIAMFYECHGHMHIDRPSVPVKRSETPINQVATSTPTHPAKTPQSAPKPQQLSLFGED